MRWPPHAMPDMISPAPSPADGRRLEELDRLDASLEADIAREKALQGDAAAAIAQLEEERSAIGQRLDEAEAQGGRLAAELGAAGIIYRGAGARLAQVPAPQAAKGP